MSDSTSNIFLNPVFSHYTTFKGTIFCSFNVINITMIYDLKYFWFWSKIRRDRTSFMSLGVLGGYSKILLAFNYFAHIRKKSVYYPCTVFCTLKIRSEYSPKTLKYSPRILRKRRQNEECAEKYFHFQQHMKTLKWQYFEKQMGNHILALEEQNKNYSFNYC